MSSIVKKMQFADKIASRSKDPSTKVGANFKSISNGIPTHPISFGYNGMPRGLNDNHPERNERPTTLHSLSPKEKGKNREG